MATYLLPCSCGQALLVQPRQSGEMVTCECGKQHEVPSLTQMRMLSPAERPAEARAGGWGFRQGVLTAGALICLSLIGAGAYVWSQEPSPPEKFDGKLRRELVATGVEGWVPKIAFEMWRWEYAPMLRRGRLEQFVNPREAALKQQITMYRLYRWGFFGLAAVVGIGSVVTATSVRSTD